MGTKERIIRTLKAFFITILFYTLLLLVLYVLFFKKITFPPAQSKEVKISLDLQSFDSIHSEETQESMQENPEQSQNASVDENMQDNPEQSQDALAEMTKKLFKKIAKAKDMPKETLTASEAEPTETEEGETISPEEATRRLFKKIANSQKKLIPPKEKIKDPQKERLAKIEEQKRLEKKVIALEKARLAKLAQEKLVEKKHKKEKEKAKEQEKMKLAKLQKQKQKILEEEKEIALEKAILAKIAQEKLIEEERQEKIMKAELAMLEEEKRLEKKEKEDKKKKEKKIAKEKKKLAKLAEKKRLDKQRKKKEKLAKQKKLTQKKAKQKELAQEKSRQKKLKEKQKEQTTLAKSIAKSSSSFSKKQNKSSAATKMINKFYGSEFNSFTGAQKKFIRKNLGNIYRITQRTLTRNGYPEVAARTQQEGTQLVTFYLHPNGKISGLRYKKSLGFDSLDKNTIKIIQIAYKNYPRPKTKTQITFYVEYSLF